MEGKRNGGAEELTVVIALETMPNQGDEIAFGPTLETLGPL